jgi:hypothetical protein
VVVERVGCRGAAGAHRIIALEAPRALERGCRLRLQVGDLR